MKRKYNNLLDYVKKHRILSISVASGAVVLIVLIIAIAVGGKTSSGSWGRGITSGVPMFSGKDRTSVQVTETYASAYFENVSSEEVAEYISEVEEKCDVTFSSERFPRSAVLEDKIIVVHYNVTETKLSVTVAAKGDHETITSGDKK